MNEWKIYYYYYYYCTKRQTQPVGTPTSTNLYCRARVYNIWIWPSVLCFHEYFLPVCRASSGGLIKHLGPYKLDTGSCLGSSVAPLYAPRWYLIWMIWGTSFCSCGCHSDHCDVRWAGSVHYFPWSILLFKPYFVTSCIESRVSVGPIFGLSEFRVFLIRVSRGWVDGQNSEYSW